MKQYKHKQSGVYVELIGEVYKRIVKSMVNTETIPRWVVENSNDWEEYKDVILTTDDGVPIYREGQELYCVSNINWTTTCYEVNRYNDLERPRKQGWKYFSTKEARLEYMVLYKPVLTLIEIKTKLGLTEDSWVIKALIPIIQQKLKQNDSNL